MIIITIDGPAAAGKGTISAGLAQKFGLAYFDTGMLYRAVGLQMLLDEADIDDTALAEKTAKELTFPKMLELSRNKDFRSDVGSRAASVVSAYPGVRAALLQMQRDFASNPVFADGTKANGAVYDGRDTGTVVCPDAELKLFVTASPEVRARRRYEELAAKGDKTTYDKVFADMLARDERDRKRAAAPLKPAADAVIIDTSDLSIDEVMQKIIPMVQKLLQSSSPA